MAKYEVLEKSFIDGSIVEAGTIIEYDGEAGTNLKLIKKAKEEAAAPAAATTAPSA